MCGSASWLLYIGCVKDYVRDDIACEAKLEWA
jgi:hypothetical protein